MINKVLDFLFGIKCEVCGKRKGALQRVFYTSEFDYETFILCNRCWASHKICDKIINDRLK